jgi:hypothetical protein
MEGEVTPKLAGMVLSRLLVGARRAAGHPDACIGWRIFAAAPKRGRPVRRKDAGTFAGNDGRFVYPAAAV